MAGGVNDPVAWAQWLDHLKSWGIVSPYTAPGNIQNPMPVVPANLNRKFFISPVSQNAPDIQPATASDLVSKLFT